MTTGTVRDGRIESQCDWAVRLAGEGDCDALAAGVRRLLIELGAQAPSEHSMRASAARLLSDPHAGIAVLAEAQDHVVGVLSASLQEAIHVPGRYALIQDLWVEPDWRRRLVGAGLIDAFLEIAGLRGALIVEVGLPKARFRGLQATEAFYRANGFALVGSRMRRALP